MASIGDVTAPAPKRMSILDVTIVKDFGCKTDFMNTKRTSVQKKKSSPRKKKKRKDVPKGIFHDFDESFDDFPVSRMGSMVPRVSMVPSLCSYDPITMPLCVYGTTPVLPDMSRLGTTFSVL